MPGPGQDEALARGLAQLLPQRHRVGQRLTGVATRRLQVDDRLLAVTGEAPDDGVLPRHGPVAAAGEGAHAERVGVAPEHPRRVHDVLHAVAVHHRAGLGLQRPAAAPGLEHHRVATVEEHRGLEAGTGAKARVHEDHRQHLPLQPAGDLPPLHPRGQREQCVDLGGRPVLQRQEVTLRHTSTSFSPARSRSASSSENESGGSRRRTRGSEAVPVMIRRANSARCTSAAGRARWRPRRSPRPLTRRTPSARAPRHRRSPTRIALSTRPLALDHIERGERGGAGHRPSAERAPQVARGDGGGDRRRRDDGADRQTGGEALGEGQHVGDHAHRFRGAEGAAAPHAALDLVEEERRAVGVAGPAGGEQEVAAQVPRAGEALHRLQDHRGDRPVHRPLQRRDVVGRHPGGERDAAPRRRLLVAGAVGARERRRRSSVPSTEHGDDPSTAGGLASQVQGVLVRLRARVAEEHPPERIGTERGETLRQLLAERARHGGRVEEQCGRLFRDGADHVRMRVPGGGHRVSAVGVEPLVSILVHQPRAVAAHRPDREGGVHREEGGQADRRTGGRFPGSSGCRPFVHQHGNIPPPRSPASSSIPRARFIA